MRLSETILRSVLVFVLLALTVPGRAQEWARFRGPNGTGIGRAANLPVRMTEAEFRWRAELPGAGHSSPVLWGEKLFVTSAEEEKGRRHIACLDARSGKRLWTRSYDFKRYHRHEYNTAASSTPTADAERVYLLWPTHESFTVLALDHAGREAWRKDFGAFPTQHGGASSPILVGDALIVAKEPEDGPGLILGLNRKTGDTLWKRERQGQPAPYSTPFLYQPKDGPPEVLFSSTAHGITSLDPRTGAVNWERSGLFRARCVGSPILAGALIVATAGSGAGDRLAVAVRPGVKRKGEPAKVAYQVTRGASYVPTPIVVGKRLYLWGDGGIVTCLEAETGKQLWTERVGGSYFGSPVSADGKLWAMSAQGELVVIAASDTFQLLGRSPLGEPSHATPAVANGVMYLRTLRHLIAIGSKQPDPARK